MRQASGKRVLRARGLGSVARVGLAGVLARLLVACPSTASPAVPQDAPKGVLQAEREVQAEPGASQRGEPTPPAQPVHPSDPPEPGVAAPEPAQPGEAAPEQAAAAEPAAPGPGETLCEAGETSFFACRAASGKSVALCGAGAGPVRYRFGRRDKVELSYPKGEGDPPLRFAHMGRFETDRYEVSFAVGGASYAVFDYTEGEEHEAGVRVTLASGREVVVACAETLENRLEDLEERLPCDPDNALNLGGCESP